MLAVLILLLAWLTRRLLGGALTLGALAMAIQALQRGLAQASSLSATLADVYQSLLFMDAFEELLALPTQVATVREPRALARPLRGGIVFDNVSFIYPGTGHMVIRDLNLSIRPSEKLAIVGANGSGKTTLIKLLARLYDPTSGRILVDGIDLREIDVADWRRRIGLLFQDFGRYQLTAAENIWLGDGRRAVDDPAIAKAAELSDLGDTARHWPDGLETRLGRWLHDGLEPSGGQWQRIALARALFRQSEILVMDEPTSALDARARREMIRRFKALTEGRMALVASHRLALARWADRVLVLRDGALVESGAATELLGADGEFRRLFAEGRLTRDDD
jgi:ATP-binding cassette subfamily B protein